MRPKYINEIVGQEHLLSQVKPLRRWLEGKKLPSIILWGPPGCGKTTLARLLAKEVSMEFETVSAIVCGVADLRKVFDMAKSRKDMGQETLLFVDEIHRFNRAQQDVFLSSMEEGIITLVGATTANPSFELNPALLSRCQVLVLNRLTEKNLHALLHRAEEHEKKQLPLTEKARDLLTRLADGDGRTILNFAETLFLYPPTPLLEPEQLLEAIHRRAALYDKGPAGHNNLISALHTSVRGSDPDAAL
ncbi:MAG: AAA family ATPase [Alphaproteobacteria bacterium]